MVIAMGVLRSAILQSLPDRHRRLQGTRLRAAPVHANARSNQRFPRSALHALEDPPRIDRAPFPEQKPLLSGLRTWRMPRTPWQISTVPSMLPGCRNGRAASDRGIDAADAPPLDR